MDNWGTQLSITRHFLFSQQSLLIGFAGIAENMRKRA